MEKGRLLIKMFCIIPWKHSENVPALAFWYDLGMCFCNKAPHCLYLLCLDSHHRAILENTRWTFFWITRRCAPTRYANPQAQIRIGPKPLTGCVAWMSGSHHQCFTLRICSYCTALVADVGTSTDFFKAFSLLATGRVGVPSTGGLNRSAAARGLN